MKRLFRQSYEWGGRKLRTTGFSVAATAAISTSRPSGESQVGPFCCESTNKVGHRRLPHSPLCVGGLEAPHNPPRMSHIRLKTTSFGDCFTPRGEHGHVGTYRYEYWYEVSCTRTTVCTWVLHTGINRYSIPVVATKICLVSERHARIAVGDEVNDPQSKLNCSRAQAGWSGACTLGRGLPWLGLRFQDDLAAPQRRSCSHV